MIGAQGIPTLQRVFKTKEKVSEILELCAYMAILRVGDGSEGGTASWAERLLGKCEFYETRSSATLSKAYTLEQAERTLRELRKRAITLRQGVQPKRTRFPASGEPPHLKHSKGERAIRLRTPVAVPMGIVVLPGTV